MERKNILKNKKLFLLDIDGTICRGDSLLEGSAEFIEEVSLRGGKAVFFTNNSTKSIEDYIEKFRCLGIKTDKSNFVTASVSAAEYIKNKHKGRLIYVMGTLSLIAELKERDIQVTTDADREEIACVLIAYDNELTYKKLADVCKILSLKDVDYIATNPDYACPAEFGYIPDCGAICKMIEYATGKKPYFTGKPETAMIDIAINNSPFTKEEALVVGDRLYTDILCGIKANVDTALVLTGEGTAEDAIKGKNKPSIIFSSIKELYKEWLSQIDD